jgi:two-component system, sensor histidine kinase and response regulator
MAHTLKGLAGNLGARELAQVAGELETALRGQNPAEAHEAMAGIKEHLAIALDSMENYERSLPAEQPGSVAVVTDEELALMAGRITGLLMKHDLKALKHIEKLQRSLEQLCPPCMVQKLTTCMDKLDFAGAAEIWKECKPLLERDGVSEG